MITLRLTTQEWLDLLNALAVAEDDANFDGNYEGAKGYSLLYDKVEGSNN